MKRFFNLLFVFLIVTGIIVFIYFFAARDKYIDEKTAIENAKRYCSQYNDVPQEEPHNIETKKFKCEQVTEQIGWDTCDPRYRDPNAIVWYVSMEGLWLHYGPPNEDGTNSVPGLIRKCQVVMDASTGEMFSLRSKE